MRIIIEGLEKKIVLECPTDIPVLQDQPCTFQSAAGYSRKRAVIAFLRGVGSLGNASGRMKIL